METRIQRPLITIPDENANAKGKMMVKNGNEMKRSALRDIASNRINTTRISLSQSTLHKSKLPVLKAGYVNQKSTVISKSKISVLKENQAPAIDQEKNLNLKTLIDKTRTLKLQKKIARRPTGVEDIDKDDHQNPFLLSTYTNDIHDYLKMLEKSHPIKEDYLKNREVTPKMRSIVIDWLVEVQQEYHLLQETLHITVAIFDTYLQNTPHVSKNHMQLIGITALFLAAKYEEITIPSAADLVYISASIFKESDLYQMEAEVFKTIGYDISRPISLSFLRRYSKAGYAQSEQHTYAKYFLELALIEYSLCHVNPSLIAASALYLALFVTSNLTEIDESLWTKTLEYYSGYIFNDLKPIIKILAKIIINSKMSKLRAVVHKYSSSKFFKISEKPCLYSDRMKKLASE